MKTNRKLLKLGYYRRVNIDFIQDISWEFNVNGKYAKVTVIFSNGKDALECFLDKEEFLEFLGGLYICEI